METEEACKTLRAFNLRLIEVLKSGEITLCSAGQLAFLHYSECRSTIFLEACIERKRQKSLESAFRAI